MAAYLKPGEVVTPKVPQIPTLALTLALALTVTVTLTLTLALTRSKQCTDWNVCTVAHSESGPIPRRRRRLRRLHFRRRLRLRRAGPRRLVFLHLALAQLEPLTCPLV